MNPQVTLEELLGQLKRIPAEWLDTDGHKVLESISIVVERINDLTIDQDRNQDHIVRRSICFRCFSSLLRHVSRYLRK